MRFGLWFGLGTKTSRLGLKKKGQTLRDTAGGEILHNVPTGPEPCSLERKSSGRLTRLTRLTRPPPTLDFSLSLRYRKERVLHELMLERNRQCVMNDSALQFSSTHFCLRFEFQYVQRFRLVKNRIIGDELQWKALTDLRLPYKTCSPWHSQVWPFKAFQMKSKHSRKLEEDSHPELSSGQIIVCNVHRTWRTDASQPGLDADRLAGPMPAAAPYSFSFITGWGKWTSRHHVKALDRASFF